MSTQGKQKSRIAESAEQLGGEEAFDIEVVAEEVDADLTAGLEATSEQPDESFQQVQSDSERMAIIEALVYVSDEPLSAKSVAEVLKKSNR